MQQAETEDDGYAPWLELCGHNVLDCDVGDRERDRRFDDARRHGQRAIHRQAKGDRVRESERGYLRKHIAHPGREEKHPQHKQDVIEPFGKNVGESERQILPDRFEARGWHDCAREDKRLARRVALDPLTRRALSLIPQRARVRAVCPAVAPGECLRVRRDVAGETVIRHFDAVEANVDRLRNEPARPNHRRRPGVVSMKDDIDPHRADLVSRNRRPDRKNEDQRSNVTDAHRLSQSTPLSFGASIM